MNYNVEKKNKVQCLAWRCIPKMWRLGKDGQDVLFTFEFRNTDSS